MSENDYEEEWECPQCHKTVMVGYTIHRDCFNEIKKELIAEFVEDLKYAVNSYLEVDTVTDKYIKILIEKWEARSK